MEPGVELEADPATLRVEAMFQPHLDDIPEFNGEEPPSAIRWVQAFIWRIGTDEAGRELVHHCGTVIGFNACLAIYPDHDLVVAVADNAESSGLAPAKTVAGFFLEERAAIESSGD